MHADAVVYRAGKGLGAGVADADPITTEVIRNGLNSAANQMKRALIRTAFSPVIYEVLDFVVANSRVPKMVAGDINAEVAGVRTGAAGLLRVVERYGLETFRECVERMFDHGEAVVRSYFEQIPDGRYVGHGVMDDDGLS